MRASCPYLTCPGEMVSFGAWSTCQTCGSEIIGEIAPTLTLNTAREVCLGCRREIDPEVCCCGASPEDPEHTCLLSYTHDFVPMGCVCGYADDADLPQR